MTIKEYVEKLWADAFVKFDPNGKDPEKLEAYKKKISEKPNDEIARTIMFLESVPEEKRKLLMERIQARAAKAPDMNYLKTVVPHYYKAAFAVTAESVISNNRGIGDAYFDGLFAATPDSSKMYYGEDNPNVQGAVLTWKEIRDKQEETNSITIQPNESVSKDLVPFVVMGKFFTSENLDGMKTYLFTPGSTIPKGFNAVLGSKSNFYDNTLKDDDRINMHAVRLFAPDARRAAKDIIESRNKTEIYNALSNCFNEMFRQVYGSHSIESYCTWLMPVRKINEFLGEIEKNGIKPEELNISKAQLDSVKVMTAIYDLQQRHAKLKAELMKTAEEFVYSDDDPSKNIYENPELMEKLQEELVLKRAISRIQKGIQGVISSYDPAGPQAEERLLPTRELSEEEAEYYEHPDQFLQKMKAEVLTLSETQKDFKSLERTGDNSYNLLNTGISVSPDETPDEIVSFDILLDRTLEPMIERINESVQGTSLEADLASNIEALRELKANSPKPRTMEQKAQYSSIVLDIQDKCLAYYEKLDTKARLEDKPAMMMQMAGAVGSAGNSFMQEIEQIYPDVAEEVEKSKKPDDDLIDNLYDFANQLTATEGNWTKNSPEYDAFAAEIKDLPDVLYKDLRLTNKTALRKMTKASKLAAEYLRTHETIEKPSDRQIRRMNLARQYQNIYTKVKRKQENKFSIQEYALAKKWFDGFKNVLQSEGIDINNPYALASVNILHDTNFKDEDNIQAVTTEQKLACLSETEKMFSYAFMPQNTKGEYYVQRPDGKANIEWLKQNMKKPAEISPADMVRLYKSAKDCRLILRNPQFGSDASVSPKYFAVAKDGGAVITGNGDLFIPDKRGNVGAKASDFNISEKDAETIALREDNRKLISFNRKSIRAEFYSPRVFENNQLRDEFQAKHDADQLEKDFCTIAAKNPGWIDSEEKINQHIKTLKASSLSEEIMTDDERAMVEDSMIFTATFQDTMASVTKRMQTDNLEQIMQSKKILKADKTPFSETDTYKFANELCRDANSGKGIWMEYEKDGKTISGVFVQNADLGLAPAVKVQDYLGKLKQQRQALNEIMKTDNGPGIKRISDRIDYQLKESLREQNSHHPYVHDGFYSNMYSEFHQGYKEYVDSLPKDKPLTEKQIDTLKVLSDVGVYAELTLRAPGSINEDAYSRLAYSMVCNKAVQMLSSDKPEEATQGRKILTDADTRRTVANEFLKSEEFERLCEGKKLADVEKMRREVFSYANNAGEVFLDGEKFDKQSYENETRYIGELFGKAKLDPAKEGPDFKTFKDLITALPAQLSELNFDKSQSVIELQTMITKAAAVGNAYARSLGNKALSKGHIACIKAINRLNDLRESVLAGEKQPSKGTAYKLAEKIATATAIKNIKKNPNAKEYLLNPAKRKAVIERIKQQPAFKKVFAEHKKSGLDKALRLSGDKLSKQYETNRHQIVKESQAQKPELDKAEDLMRL